MMDDNLRQHYHLSEYGFIQQTEDWFRRSMSENRPVLTHFLNPREQYILQTMTNRQTDLGVAFNGGYPTAEVKRAVISPHYFQTEWRDFELSLLTLNYPIKFIHLRHADILGSLLALGIERNVLGDVLTDRHKQRWQLVVDQRMVRFIEETASQIGQAKVTWQQESWTNLLSQADDWQETFILTASLRLDALISAAFGLQRKVAKDMSEQGMVQINWTPCQKADRLVAIRDMISVRRLGRLRLESIDGRSKRDKIKVNAAIIRR